MSYEWLNDESRTFLSRGYLKNGTTPEERLAEIAKVAECYLEQSGATVLANGFAEKFLGYLSNGWYSLSTPVWINYGNRRGLPASCNGSYISDNMASILSKTAEIGMMTKCGAGTSAYIGNLRPKGAPISCGGESDGPVHFMRLLESTTEVVTQGSSRRGSCAVYLPVEHPDIKDFLKCRSIGSPIQQLSIGVCISDQWMNDLKNKKQENLSIWAAIIRKRYESGFPYIFFTDTVNNSAPEAYIKNNKRILASNLCSEITLSSSDDESFVCVLSSMNVEHYDEWKNTDAVETLTYFLDTVCTEYINKSAEIPLLSAACNFVRNQRAIGIGVLGLHTYFQKKGVAFGSMDSMYMNSEIFKHIDESSKNASMQLAALCGEPELMSGTNERMVTRMAVAPTKSSSFIHGGISGGIEPIECNYFVEVLAKITTTKRNPLFMDLLRSKKLNNKKIIDSVVANFGSCQHLDELTDEEKNVFKTFSEISQRDIITMAAQRQRYIDQSQSLNLSIPLNTPPKEVSQLLLYGWENGIKTFYYNKGTNPSQELNRKMSSCSACEG